MKLQEVTGYNSRTAQILTEGYQDLTEAQVLYLGKWEKELWPLVEQYTRLAEAELTKDQIKDIFNRAEEVAMAGGDNKTLAGKAGGAAAAAAKLPVDMAKKVSAKIDELGRMAKNAGPVKNADQKFNDLKKQITANNSDSKVVQGIQKISDWAKENPGKASLAVGILTTMAAFAAGPAGGAAIGLILRSTKGLLQGEDLSTATGKALKTAAVGALAGMAFDALGDVVLDNFAAASEAEINGMIDDFEGVNVDLAMNNIDPELQALFPELEDASILQLDGNINRFYYDYDVVMTPDLMNEYESLVSAMNNSETFSEDFYKNAAELHDFLAGVQNDAMQEQYKSALAALDAAQNSEALTSQQWDAVLAADDVLTDKLNSLSNLDDAVAAAAQAGAQEAADDKKNAIKASKPKESEQGEPPLDKSNESLTMEDRFELYLAEAGFMDKLKGAAGKVAGAVKQAGKDVGNKVTANKLIKTWKSMGEPTDSGSIANILQDAGMTDDQIKQINQPNKVALDPASDTGTAQPASKKAPVALKKGTVQNKSGKDYRWEGALWVDVETNKPLGVQTSFDLGLPNPKLQPIIAAAKKDPALAKLIKTQVNAKGVKPGTAGAQKAQQAGVKGTEKLKTA